MKDLIELTLELVEAQKTIASQQQTIEDQQARIKELEEKLAAAKRAEKRQATPFAKSQEKRVKDPKRPGRKPQKGQFRHRNKPDKVDITKQALLHQCPLCQSTDLKNFHTHENFQIDIPRIQPLITRFITQSAECQKCHCPVQSRHPQQLSLATGAACVCMGPKVLALAADMHEHMGCSYEKIADCLTHLFGFPITRSALCQALDRLLKKAEPVYQQLLGIIRKASVVHADETGWKVGSLNAWLWVFTNSELTVYTIRSGEGARAHQVVLDVLGKTFQGILMCAWHGVLSGSGLSPEVKKKSAVTGRKDNTNKAKAIPVMVCLKEA